ncbi:heterokaryon incompatibility protein-domain-containing protein [Xylaria telfairii]|nr:heterokaryon incompatibility protein-domain-containing protein [Xylaria telfairii]
MSKGKQRARETLYEPLPPDHFRVIELEDTGTYLNATINCCLRAIPLSDIKSGNVSYAALSYVWGHMETQRPIVCNGIPTNIGANLYDALWQFVSGTCHIPTYLWIDSLCINQGDHEEKADQVRRMGDIYREAELVLVWLGTGSGMAGGAFDRFWRGLREDSSGNIRLDAGDREVGVNFLRNADWFYRAWTFQEIALARSALVFCGPFSAPWETIISQFSDDIDAIKYLKQMSSSKRPKTLLELLKATANRNATDPRDMIYSILGLYSGSQELIPKYNVSVEHVFAEAAVAIANEEGFLTFHLSGIRYLRSMWLWDPSSHQQMLHLNQEAAPRSWIPDWSRLKSEDVGNNTDREIFSYPALHSSFQMNIRLSGSNLVARGLVLGHWVRLNKGQVVDWHYEGKGVLQGFPKCVASATTGKTRSGTFTDNWQFDEGEKSPAYFPGSEIHNMLLDHCHGACSCRNPNPRGMMESLKYHVHGSRMDRWLVDTGPCSCGGEVPSIETWGWLCLIFGSDLLLIMQPVRDINSEGNLKFYIRHILPTSNPENWQTESVRAQLLVGQQKLMPQVRNCPKGQHQQLQWKSDEPLGPSSPRLEKCHLNWIPTEFEIVGDIPEIDQIRRKDPPCSYYSSDR